MAVIFILGISLLGALACTIYIKYLVYNCDTISIEYMPMDTNLEENEHNANEVPPKYDDINHSN